MKKDILFPKVEGVSMAIVKEEIEGELQWNVYVINEKDAEIYGVLVVCKGYGLIENEPRKTSQMRYFLDKIPAQTVAKVESIQPELFQLSNEYWLSFYEGAALFDKKFIFLAGSVHANNFTTVPIIDKLGVLHS